MKKKIKVERAIGLLENILRIIVGVGITSIGIVVYHLMLYLEKGLLV